MHQVHLGACSAPMGVRKDPREASGLWSSEALAAAAFLYRLAWDPVGSYGRLCQHDPFVVAVISRQPRSKRHQSTKGGATRPKET